MSLYQFIVQVSTTRVFDFIVQVSITRDFDFIVQVSITRDFDLKSRFNYICLLNIIL